MPWLWLQLLADHTIKIFKTVERISDVSHCYLGYNWVLAVSMALTEEYVVELKRPSSARQGGLDKLDTVDLRSPHRLKIKNGV